MRIFLRAHWKALVAIVLLVVLALLTVNPGAAVPAPSLAVRLQGHMDALRTDGDGSAGQARLERDARYIEHVLKSEGYAVRRRARNIEVSVAGPAPEARPARIFIVGANGSGAAAVLELARLLKDLRPSRGTEVKFVFFVNEASSWLGHSVRNLAMGAMPQAPDPLALDSIGWYPQERRPLEAGWQASGRPDAGRPDAGRPDAGNFIAFVGTREAARQVQDALSAFRALSDFPAHGLAAPAYVQGVTLSRPSSLDHSGYPAIMITDTAFMRYPYYKMSTEGGAPDASGQPDYEGAARVVQGLARTIVALASGVRG